MVNFTFPGSEKNLQTEIVNQL